MLADAGRIEVPSDYPDVYIPMDRQGNWKTKLLGALQGAKMQVDPVKALEVRSN